jgi:hypothetical protein
MENFEKESCRSFDGETFLGKSIWSSFLMKATLKAEKFGKFCGLGAVHKGQLSRGRAQKVCSLYGRREDERTKKSKGGRVGVRPLYTNFVRRSL